MPPSQKSVHQDVLCTIGLLSLLKNDKKQFEASKTVFTAMESLSCTTCPQSRSVSQPSGSKIAPSLLAPEDDEDKTKDKPRNRMLFQQQMDSNAMKCAMECQRLQCIAV